MMIRTFVTVIVVWTLGVVGGHRPDSLTINWLAGGAVHAQQSEPQDEFVPIDELSPQDQLPAAPLLVAAYAFVVLALFGYLVSVARRLGRVQRDLDRLESDLDRSGRT